MELVEVVEFCVMYVILGDDFDVVDYWGVYWEGVFDVDLEVDFVDCEGFVDVVVLMVDDDVLEDLDMRVVVFGDVDVYFDGVVGIEVGDVGMEGSCVDGIEDLYDCFFLYLFQVGCMILEGIRKGVCCMVLMCLWVFLRQSWLWYKELFCYGSGDLLKL